MVERAISYTWRATRRAGIALAGGLVLLAGVLMIVLPGPAVVAIPAGLGILALEFEFARRWLDTVRAHSRKLLNRQRKTS